ncbi:MAG: hypothetical protein OXH96_15505 [Spirochaetaceae bacterium]|nr:hypothetical protein [Spirochaetaceae bacterium]
MSDRWLQHVNVKFPAAGGIDLTEAIPVFHRWIQEQALPGLLVDVADYRHVPEGPGLVLVAHEAIYGLDEGGGWLGLLYNRRTEHDAGPAEAAAHAFRAALTACRKLEQEPEFSGSLHFDASACEVVVNDRALAPNDDATRTRLLAVLAPLLDRLWGAGSYTTMPVGEARDRLGISARCTDSHSVGSVLDRL